VLDAGKSLDELIWNKLNDLGVSERVQQAIVWEMALAPEDRPHSGHKYYFSKI
jgi:hypothetical protein